MRKCLVICALGVAVTAFLGCEEALENGTISGHVKDNGQNVNGAFVLLLDEGQLLGGNSPLSNASLTNGSGNYTIYMVTPEKNFYVVAVKDEDGDMKYTPGVDPIGYYGTYNNQTGIWVPAAVSVASGEHKSGINVNDMYVIPAD